MPYTQFLGFIKYCKSLNPWPQKSPKVPAVFSDKEVEGKITVGKGGGNKKPTACLKKAMYEILKPWQERQI
jgi:hypothetical protein